MEITAYEHSVAHTDNPAQKQLKHVFFNTALVHTETNPRVKLGDTIMLQWYDKSIHPNEISGFWKCKGKHYKSKISYIFNVTFQQTQIQRLKDLIITKNWKLKTYKQPACISQNNGLGL